MITGKEMRLERLRDAIYKERRSLALDRDLVVVPTRVTGTSHPTHLSFVRKKSGVRHHFDDRVLDLVTQGVGLRHRCAESESDANRAAQGESFRLLLDETLALLGESEGVRRVAVGGT